MSHLFTVVLCLLVSGNSYAPAMGMSSQGHVAQPTSVEWQANVRPIERDDQFSKPVLFQNLVLMTNLNGGVFAFDVESGDIEWRFSLPGRSYKPPTIDGHLALAIADNKLVVLEAQSGDLIWEYIIRPGGIITSVISDDDRFYVATSEGLRALDKGSGGEVFRIDHLTSVSTLVGSKLIASGFDGRIVAVSTIDASIQWELELAIEGNIEMSYSGGYVIAVASNGALYQIAPETGALLSSIQLATGPVGINSLIAQGDESVLVQFHTRLVLVNPTEGSVIWSGIESTHFGENFSANVSVTDTQAITGFLDGMLVSYSMETGIQDWVFNASDGVVGVEVLDDGDLIITTNTNQILRLSAEQGSAICEGVGIPTVGVDASHVEAGSTVIVSSQGTTLLAAPSTTALEFETVPQCTVLIVDGVTSGTGGFYVKVVGPTTGREGYIHIQDIKPVTLPD